MNKRSCNEVSNCSICNSIEYIRYSGLTDRMNPGSARWNIYACTNVNCRVHRIDPSPSDEELLEAYKHYYTHSTARNEVDTHFKRAVQFASIQYLKLKFHYDSNASANYRWLGMVLYFFPDKRAKIEHSIFWQQSRPFGTFLEIGFGNCSSLELLRKLGWNVLGCEYDEVAVSKARLNGFTVHHGELSDWRLASKSVDAIGLSHVIEHLREPSVVIRECYRVLVDGGELVLITPNVNSLAHRIFHSNWASLDPPRHLQIYTVDALASLALAEGFSIKMRATSGRDSHRSFAASRSIRRIGHFEMGGTFSNFERLYGRIFSVLLICVGMVSGSFGEETVLVLTKNADAKLVSAVDP